MRIWRNANPDVEMQDLERSAETDAKSESQERGAAHEADLKYRARGTLRRDQRLRRESATPLGGSMRGSEIRKYAAAAGDPMHFPMWPTREATIRN